MKIHERGLVMKLARVEQTFDGSRLIFYFTADSRVDFRELVRDLAAEFRTRIEMRQIGVRDEARHARRLRVVRAAAVLHDLAAVVRADLDQDGEAAGPEPEPLEALGSVRPVEVLPALRAARTARARQYAGCAHEGGCSGEGCSADGSCGDGGCGHCIDDDVVGSLVQCPGTGQAAS